MRVVISVSGWGNASAVLVVLASGSRFAQTQSLGRNGPLRGHCKETRLTAKRGARRGAKEIDFNGR